MNELKVHNFVSIDELHQDNLYTCSGLPYYLKSEADKVIADLKDKGDKIIFDLKDKLQKESTLLKETRDCLIESQKMHKRCADNAVKAIRHQKYRRCLDKIKWCDERIARYSLQQDIQGISWQKEIVFYRRLKNKFIEISRQFEEAK